MFDPVLDYVLLFTRAFELGRRDVEFGLSRELREVGCIDDQALGFPSTAILVGMVRMLLMLMPLLLLLSLLAAGRDDSTVGQRVIGRGVVGSGGHQLRTCVASTLNQQPISTHFVGLPKDGHIPPRVLSSLAWDCVSDLC